MKHWQGEELGEMVARGRQGRTLAWGTHDNFSKGKTWEHWQDSGMLGRERQCDVGKEIQGNVGKVKTVELCKGKTGGIAWGRQGDICEWKRGILARGR